MNIKQLTKYQLDFDKKRGFDNNKPRNLDDLIFNSIAISGELGEFLNLVKKKIRKEKYEKLRGDEKEISEEELKEELIDVFIYFLKICAILDIDIEKEYFKKLEKVKSRFK
jgi:NTP pyrophosphatase (non-canonical NTP hydrolase)